MSHEKFPKIMRIIMFVIAASMVVKCLIGIQIEWTNIWQVLFALCSCVLMEIMMIDVDGISPIDFVEVLVAFLFFTYDYRIAVVFLLADHLLVFIINRYLGNMKRKVSSMIVNASMFIIDAFSTSMIIGRLWGHVDITDAVQVTGATVCYILIYITINLFILVLYNSIRFGKLSLLHMEMLKLIAMSTLISIIIAIAMVLVNASYGLVGTILSLACLLCIDYCLCTNKKLEIKNDVMNGIIRITKDVARYGDLAEKCKYVVIHLKDLIPYTTCAVYSFSSDNRIYENGEISYPVAFYKPEEVDIGDLTFSMPAKEEVRSAIRSGNIYVTSNPKEDFKGYMPPDLIEHTETAILVPVSIENKLVGMIFVGGTSRLMHFYSYGADDILSILSNQMALAIENNNIYNDVRDSADIDSLTGLFNRNAYNREINKLIGLNTSFSLVIYDVDDFKKVNDTYGHLAGDEILKKISSEIRNSIRKTDIPCRYGGEEIVIIFKDLSKEDAVVISERIRKKIEQAQLQWNDSVIKVTVSGGIASYPEDGETVENIIGRADEVLYSECKQKGKNKVFAYGTSILEKQSI